MSPFWVELLTDLTTTTVLLVLVALLILFWRAPKCPR